VKDMLLAMKIAFISKKRKKVQLLVPHKIMLIIQVDATFTFFEG